MRKIILDVAITLDGFIEGPHGEIDWLVANEETDFGDILIEILSDVDSIFYGRKSYDLWGNYHPPGNSSLKLKEAYRILHSKKKYVFSKTKTDNNGTALFINNNIEERVREILQEPGKNIWLYGGSSLVTAFVNLNLVDIYRLAVHPVILGWGKSLFQDIKEKVQLKLIESKADSSGVVLLKYGK